MAHETNTPPEDDSRLQPMQDLNAAADDVLSEDSMPLADDVPDHSDNQLDSIEFKVDTAQRVKRLPPYMFGRINNLLYQKRRAGEDVIDMGMGNPSDPPQQLVVDKLAEAAANPRVHGYSKSNGIQNLRKEVAAKYLRKYGVTLDPDEEVITCLGSKEGFSHMCLALMGPGDTAIVPAPIFRCIPTLSHLLVAMSFL